MCVVYFDFTYVAEHASSHVIRLGDAFGHKDFQCNVISFCDRFYDALLGERH